MKENRLDVARQRARSPEGQQVAPDLRSIDGSLVFYLDAQRGSLMRNCSYSNEGRSAHLLVLVEHALAGHAEERF